MVTKGQQHVNNVLIWVKRLKNNIIKIWKFLLTDIYLSLYLVNNATWSPSLINKLGTL